MGLPARKFNPGAECRIVEVTLSLDGRRLVFVFESGEGYSVLRNHLPGDDGSPIVSIQIFDHQGAVSITQAGGVVYDLPWDSIKYYAGGGRQKRYSCGKTLRKFRMQRHLSQNRLAKAAGISRMQLSRLESNRSNPTLETMLKLAASLGVPPGDFMGI